MQQLQNGIEGYGGEADLPDDANAGLEPTEAFEDTVDYTLGGSERNGGDGDGDTESSNGNNETTIALTPDQPGYRATGKTFLSSEFHGSRRHLKKLSQNGLIVVSAKGPPHLFITLTCNTE